MDIGVSKIVLDFYQNDQLKIKKRNIESFCKDVKRKFNVSFLEIEEFQDLERCVIGLAAVLPSHWKGSEQEQFIQKVLQYIDQNAFARVIHSDWEILSF